MYAGTPGWSCWRDAETRTRRTEQSREASKSPSCLHPLAAPRRRREGDVRHAADGKTKAAEAGWHGGAAAAGSGPGPRTGKGRQARAAAAWCSHGPEQPAIISSVCASDASPLPLDSGSGIGIGIVIARQGHAAVSPTATVPVAFAY